MRRLEPIGRFEREVNRLLEHLGIAFLREGGRYSIGGARYVEPSRALEKSGKRFAGGR